MKILNKGTRFMGNSNNFRKNLISLRGNAGISQEQLAEKLGISRQSISKWESGEAMPEIKMLTSLCDIFKVSLDDLVHGKTIDKEVPLRQEYEGAVRKYAKNAAFGIFGFALGMVCIFVNGILPPADKMKINPELVSFGLIAATVLLIVGSVIMLANGRRRFGVFRKRHASLSAIYTDAEAESLSRKYSLRSSIGILALTAGVLAAFGSLIANTAEPYRMRAMLLTILSSVCALTLPFVYYNRMVGASYDIEKYNHNNSELSRALRKKLDLVWGIVAAIVTIGIPIPDVMGLDSEMSLYFSIFLPLSIGWVITEILKYRFKR